jgi:hypothetical protein
MRRRNGQGEAMAILAVGGYLLRLDSTTFGRA